MVPALLSTRASRFSKKNCHHYHPVRKYEDDLGPDISMKYYFVFPAGGGTRRKCAARCLLLASRQLGTVAPFSPNVRLSSRSFGSPRCLAALTHVRLVSAKEACVCFCGCRTRANVIVHFFLSLLPLKKIVYSNSK